MADVAGAVHAVTRGLVIGLAGVLYGLALRQIVRRQPAWTGAALPWARVGFLAGALDLAVGAWTRDQAPGPDGFWSWAPVEVAEFLAFLAWIPLVHGLIYLRKNGMMPVLTPAFGVLVLPLNLYAWFVRESRLWEAGRFLGPVSDPAAGALAALEADPVLRALMSCLLAALVTPWLLWLGLARTREDRMWATARRALGAFFGVLLVAAFVDPALAIGALAEAGRVLWPGHAVRGGWVLVFFLVGLFSVPEIWRARAWQATKEGWLDRWIVMRRLVHVGMWLVSLGVAAGCFLHMEGAGGYDAAVWSWWATVVTVPLVLTLGVALSNQTIGRGVALLAAAGAGVVGASAAWMGNAHRELWLLLPALVFALVGCVIKLFKVSDPGARGPAGVRWAGGLALFGGLSSSLFWVAGPAGSWLSPAVPSVALAATGAILGALGGLAAPATLRGRNRRVAVAGALAVSASGAIMSVPWGLLWLLVGGAALFLLRSRDFVGPVAGWDAAATLRDLKRDLRKTGTYLIHVAVVLGLIGLATSLHGRDDPSTWWIRMGEAVEAGGGRLTWTDGGVQPSAWVAWLRFDARDTTQMLELRLVSDPTHPWRDDPATVSTAWGDLRLRLLELQARVNDTGFRVVAGEDSDPVPGTPVLDSILVEVVKRPAVNLVWAAAWAVPFAAVVVLLAGGLEPQGGRGQRPTSTTDK